MARDKFSVGSYVRHIDGHMYRIVHIDGKQKVDGILINLYGCCRLNMDGITPNRKFLRVPGPDDNFGRFRVFTFREDQLTLVYKSKIIIMKPLPFTVFPSDKLTIMVDDLIDPDYGGAHSYQFQNSRGFNNGRAEYEDSYQTINFVMKREDGSMMAGVQTEQLLIALIDRHNKLNAKFPSREGALAITKMQEALHWLEQRVKDRMERGVMGDLKK